MDKEKLKKIKVLYYPYKAVKETLYNFDVKRKANAAQIHYKRIIKEKKEKSKDKVVNFAAYVVFDSTYGMDGVFQLMLDNPTRWNPKIVVIPDIARGQDHAVETYKKTKDFFVKKYGQQYVLDGWNYNIAEYYDLIEDFDIVYYANPYDAMVHKYHSIEYASKKSVLPVYISYGYDISKTYTMRRLKSPELNLVWKCFTDTLFSYEDYKRCQIIKGKNVTLAGYAKMDDFAKCSNQNNKRQKVLISPHHTISDSDLPLSNFLKYSDLILRLPEMFPDLDFVFRPHPLLFTNLRNGGFWGEEKIDEYINNLQEKGIEYSTGGDYLHIFSECDAIINDCGSFTIEWLYTGKPGCFVYNDKLNSDLLTTLMNESLEQYYIARTEDDILSFLKTISERKENTIYKMSDWTKNNVAINYPNVSKFILNELDIKKNN